MTYVFDTTRTARYRFPTHTNLLVMDRAEATASEVFISVMEPGEAPPMHVHHDTEQVFYVLEGRGRLEIRGESEGVEIEPGDLVRIPPSTYHRVWGVGERALRYLVVDCFPGGRPTDEPTWDDHVRTVCDDQGWSFDDVARGPDREG
ncbi:MAG: cupin domain-containing protein [Trueperaceae bacterium]|nr:cupin domain-containing protein [Trueperaceae bacterium]